ncbi:hypothetical protein GPJ61_10750 [Brevibacillus formosus]|uniref:polymorphic toxin-type HINT domain-containing protein n=1 Tax=Brevibacillus formosus TaxID=54913 RepID=UPI001CA5A14B|nr:polymorphic toxin-type HINT domain-containing protein [Brevibacillus formosus]MBW5468334.1 hypothetical protein [Brevibacillus formosus]
MLRIECHPNSLVHFRSWLLSLEKVCREVLFARTLVKDLKVGGLLVSSNGTKLAIDKIEKESREATVYNFEVADFNSYLASNIGIWVHNCCCKELVHT